MKIICLLLCSLVSLKCLSQPGWDRGDNSSSNDNGSVTGAVSTKPPLSIEIDNRTIKIYEFGRNEVIQNTSNKKYGTKYWDLYYFYLLPYVISQIEIDNNNKSVLKITLNPISVDKNKILNSVQENLNSYAKLTQVNPLTVFGVKITYNNVSNTKIASGGMDLDHSISMSLKFKDAISANSAKEEILNKAPLNFEYQVKMLIDVRNSLKVDRNTAMQTETYKDISSPAHDKSIWSFQDLIYSMAVIDEVSLYAHRENSSDEFTNTLFERLTNSFLSQKAFDEISFDKKNSVTDVNGQRFATDELYSLAEDAKNMTEDEWCEKVQNSLSQNSTKDQTNNSGGGGGFNIKKIFSIKGDGHKNTTEHLSDALKKVFSSSDCGKKIIQNSFNYQWNGKKYTPKSIYITDNLLSTLDKTFKNIATSITANVEFRNIPTQIFIK